MEMLTFALALAAAFPIEIGDVLVPAYLDAGTGSLVFQVLVASLVSAGVVFGGVMSQLRSFFSRVVLRRPSESSATEAPPSSGEATIDSRGEQVADDRHTTWESDGQRKSA